VIFWHHSDRPYRNLSIYLAQVFDALSYDGDHEEEINAHIERNRIRPPLRMTLKTVTLNGACAVKGLRLYDDRLDVASGKLQ
jgi:hypothetical protein